MTAMDLASIRDILREELSAAESRIMPQVDDRIKNIQAETMKNFAVLMDGKFMTHVALLAEGHLYLK